MELYGIKINSLNIERAEQFQLSAKINQISSEKLSLKNVKIYKECMDSFTFLPPAISQFLMAAISFGITCKELKIT